MPSDSPKLCGTPSLCAAEGRRHFRKIKAAEVRESATRRGCHHFLASGAVSSKYCGPWRHSLLTRAVVEPVELGRLFWLLRAPSFAARPAIHFLSGRPKSS